MNQSHKQRVAIWTRAGTLVLLFGGAARADLPAPRSVEFALHWDEDDIDSPLRWVVVLDLTAEQISGESVGWHIDKFTVTKHNSSGVAVRTWTKVNPSVATGDGRWWITHAEAQNPETEEFVEPPLMTGTAASTDSPPTNLTFSWDGDTPPTPPPGFAAAAAVDWEFDCPACSIEDEGGDTVAEVDDAP